MNPKEQEIFEELKELAKSGAAKTLNEFYILALCDESVRTNLTNEEANLIYLLNDLLGQLQNIPE